MNSPPLPSPSEPDVLLFETSPDGSIDAIVQHDGRTVYFYLNAREGSFGTRACWVRNLVPAPYEISKSDLEKAIPPLLPRFCCSHPNGLALPQTERLRVVWFEEGNGIALFEDQSLLAVIPPWSGSEGFHGYARDCLAENEVCWPLPAQPALLERIERADEFWRSWKIGDPWLELRDALQTKYRHRYGAPNKSYQVNRDEWPPLQIDEYGSGSSVVLVTLGMCLRPQPNVELAHEYSSGLRRIELGLEFRSAPPWKTVDQAVEILAGQARYPWRKWTWLGDGHVAKLIRDVQISFFLRFGSERTRRGELIRYRQDPVHLLWIEPTCDTLGGATGSLSNNLTQGG